MNNAILPTPRDVLNGRGQGVQRHLGNVKYRKLVFANKVSGEAGMCGIDLFESTLYLLQMKYVVSHVPLLFALQGLYAKCPRADKIKISRVSFMGGF
jgi:hypothetical protein